MTSKNLYSETIDGGRINVRYRINEKNKIGIYTEFSTYYPRSTRELFCFTVDGIKTITICQINKKQIILVLVLHLVNPVTVVLKIIKVVHHISVYILQNKF